MLSLRSLIPKHLIFDLIILVFIFLRCAEVSIKQQKYPRIDKRTDHGLINYNKRS